MKKTNQKLLSLLLVLVLALGLAACSQKAKAPEGIWKDALYTADTTLGRGETTLTAVVEIEDKSVTFTVKTDKENVAEALMEHNLVSGEEGPYGLYIKKVNGITADYDVDGHYWAFYEGENYALQGAELTKIDPAVTYRFVYAK